jgi:hypothetical protein
MTKVIAKMMTKTAKTIELEMANVTVYTHCLYTHSLSAKTRFLC